VLAFIFVVSVHNSFMQLRHVKKRPIGFIRLIECSICIQCSFSRPSHFSHIQVCEQLPGANLSPIITKRRQSCPWPQGTKWLNFGMS